MVTKNSGKGGSRHAVFDLSATEVFERYLAELGSSLQVELHGTMPDPEWFTGFREVELPDDPHGKVIARP